MRLFFRYEKGFHKCNLYTKIFDSISVQRSLSEQKDSYVNFMVQALQNQFLDCGGLFRLLQERWHHLRHLSHLLLLIFFLRCACDKQGTSTHYSLFYRTFPVLHTISLIKIFLYAMNINNFITSCVWYRIKTKQVINWQKFWPINSSNNMNLLCKAFQYDSILFQRAKLWEGFGLTDNTSAFWPAAIR